jgi:NAD(P)-dependent dehydrogenase (short-subunit alcohol dehydrogenase family)
MRPRRPGPPFTLAGVRHGFVRAQALAPGIRVNGVGPGPTLPSIHQTPEEFAAEAGATLLQRPGSPEAVAEAVLWLIDARMVTGQMIAVDGGQHLAWRTPDIQE